MGILHNYCILRIFTLHHCKKATTTIYKLYILVAIHNQAVLRNIYTCISLNHKEYCLNIIVVLQVNLL